MDAAARLSEERTATEAQLAALDAEWADIVAGQDLVATDDEHDPEGATIAFERSRVSALAEQARAHLREIAAAEDRLADGSYGRCLSCGAPIAAARLEARPTASRCIACAS